MSNDNEWYAKMAVAVNDLKKMENGVARWEEKRAAAQKVIDDLVAEREGRAPEAQTEPEPTDAPAEEAPATEPLAVTEPFTSVGIPGGVVGGNVTVSGAPASATIGPVFSVSGN